jgi:post-segregation antitoxin (ccd killing protein)
MPYHIVLVAASPKGTLTMTTIEVKLDLPEQLAREAQAAGLLTPKALTSTLRDAVRRQAAIALLEGAARATDAGSEAMTMDEIQQEVNAVRRARRAKANPDA